MSSLHEYQAKQLLAEYGLDVPNFRVAFNADDATKAAKELDSSRWVVKAQVYAGGRGKAGGVKIVDTIQDVAKVARNLYGTNLVTEQTDERGQPINCLLIEEPANIDRELYLSAIIDRNLQKLIIIASTEGGVDIEKVAAETPEKIFKVVVDSTIGIQPFQCRSLGFKLELNSSQTKQLQKYLFGLCQLFIDRDLSLVEINPLTITKDGNLLCLDGKITVDDNALYRQKELNDMRDVTQEDERENRAKDWGLNYISLSGDIGCMVNGAGLAMATMDVIKLHGGSPANFLDVGGGATKERVTEAFKIILSDKNVKGILVNIFGGIVRCDLIAEGIVGAVEEVGISIPVVVRLEGNLAQDGKTILESSSMNIIAATDLSDAADKIIAAVKDN